MFGSIAVHDSPTTTVMVTATLVIFVEPSDTWQLYRPESVTLRGEKEYVDDV